VNIFNDYSLYYDLLYSEKDYISESNYIHYLIQKYAPNVQQVLELGCGTGIHAMNMARLGYTVHGIDMSSTMLQQAENRVQDFLKQDVVSLSIGDVRDLQLNKTFDAIISLFHVISYQITNKDLDATFATVKRHLKPNGIFIFDCWYGPGVLSDPPRSRIKRVENENMEVIRLTESEVYSHSNTVDVSFHMLIKDKVLNEMREVKETHTMRYLFVPEIQKLCQTYSMELLFTYTWLKEDLVSTKDWNLCIGIRMQGDK
jgi:ubiquinone/menaquinone biosynthesis C-methylase UbiE